MINMTQVMNRWYLPEHNKQYQDVTMESTIKEAMEGDHKWRLIETGYVAFKNMMMFISTAIFITAFIEWPEENSYLRFIGFILLFHHHPSITSVHMMRWVKLHYRKYGYGVWPCASPCFMPLVMWLERNNEEHKRHSATRLFFDAELKWITMINHWVGTEFETAIRTTIAEGGDTDTNACIVGGLIGAFCGLDKIPNKFNRSCSNPSIDRCVDRCAQFL
eukprot:117547_1